VARDVVETARLRGERPRAEHAPLYAELLGNPEVASWLFAAPLDGAPRSPEQAAEWLANDLDHWTQIGFGVWIFFEVSSERFIGRGGLRRVEICGRPTVEVTFALLPEAWGQGYATEIGRQAVEVAEVVGLDEVCGLALPTNRASQRALEKSGLRHQGEIEHVGLPHWFGRLVKAPRGSSPRLS
jgi:RimJ/RimL family protein N-acetyltransferase